MSKLTDYKKRYGNEIGDTIPVVIVSFHGMSDLWMHKSEYEEGGKFKGLLKNMCIPIKWVKKVFHVNKKASSFPTQEWEG